MKSLAATSLSIGRATGAAACRLSSWKISGLVSA
jgi:hypothetical protein